MLSSTIKRKAFIVRIFAMAIFLVRPLDAMTEQELKIIDLKNEIIIKILQKIRFEQLSLMKLVCKKFNSILNEDWWRSIDRHYFQGQKLYQPIYMKNKSHKEKIQKRLSIRDHVFKMGTWPKEDLLKAASDYQFLLWRMDLLLNHLGMLQTQILAFTPAKVEQLLGYILAYYVVYIESSHDAALHLAISSELMGANYPDKLIVQKGSMTISDNSEWQQARYSIKEIFMEHKLTCLNKFKELVEEIRMILADRGIEDMANVFAKIKDESYETRILAQWRLANLYVLACMNQLCMRDDYLVKTYRVLWPAIAEDWRRTPNRAHLVKIIAADILLKCHQYPDNPHFVYMEKVIRLLMSHFEDIS